MSAAKTIYRCQECGAASPRWAGKCPGCGQWNTLVEERAPAKEEGRRPGGGAGAGRGGKGAAGGAGGAGADGKRRAAALTEARALIRPITEIDATRHPRLHTGIKEFDRLLGGGIVPGSVCLVGGEPGIGKSTLLLQAAHRLAAAGAGRVLYVSGEESAEQVRLRADRLGCLDANLLILPETDAEVIEGALGEEGLCMAVVDSVQTLYDPQFESAPGSVAQLRECAARLFYRAKALRLPLFLIGHVTKAGTVAGPRLLEHIVDAVLYFEGERSYNFRLLRAVKNRYGSTDELGVFTMTNEGLAEVENPSEVFLRERPAHAPGSVIAATMEGTRPLLVEVQALTSPNGGFGAPRRVANGLDPRRLALLLAVLEKRAGMRLGDQDVFASLAGGLRVEEPAVDLAIVCAVASSLRTVSVPEDMVIVGEVGLSGEIRTVSHLERRLSEARRLGFRQALVSDRTRLPRGMSERSSAPDSITILRADTINKALDLLMLG